MTSTSKRTAPFEIGITNYAGPAVDAMKQIKLSNHSEIADEQQARRHLSEIEDVLAQDDKDFFTWLDTRTSK